MVYVARDGTVRDGPKPWGKDRLKETFWSFVSAIELFFQTLIPAFPSSSNRSVGYRSTGGSSSSSSSSRRGPGSSTQFRGGFRTMSDIAPPPTMGGCSGGSCGM
ncbi:selenoprotein K-like [Planococcus citri]|uniref:selenoprotein K-like n=1 Tax=Planococcus citri TaxID=170843 RepID=UPI0031F8F452